MDLVIRILLGPRISSFAQMYSRESGLLVEGHTVTEVDTVIVGTRSGRRRTLATLFSALVAALSMTACLTLPGDTGHIQLVSSSTANGWQYDYYENSAYPCSISGYQTFVVGTKVGSSSTASSPLWVWMHGGGVGYFNASGTPEPNSPDDREFGGSRSRPRSPMPGLSANIQADPAGFRMLAVSTATATFTAAQARPIPTIRTRTRTDHAKTTNGLQATRRPSHSPKPNTRHRSTSWREGAPDQRARTSLPGRNSSQGTRLQVWSVTRAWKMLRREPPRINRASVGTELSIPTPSRSSRSVLDPQIADIDNEVDKLVSSGQLTVPFLHIWNHADVNTCGSTPMQCPLRNGSVVTMGATDCDHQPLAAAITAEGPNSTSENLPLCVQLPGTAVVRCTSSRPTQD